jgi:hypothetical protein
MEGRAAVVLKPWQEAICKRLQRLLDEGFETMEHAHFDRDLEATLVPIDSYVHWRVGILAVLTQALGPDGLYVREFSSYVEPKHHTVESMTLGSTLVVSALDAMKEGCLDSVEELACASVFSDFLETADHLLTQGYKDPAASLAGAVLENGLRRIARSRDVPVKEEDGLSTLDQKLYQAKAYSLLDKKHVQLWTQLRNEADHGHFGRYDAKQVGGMISGVASFLGRFLAPTAPEKGEAQDG